MSRNSRFVFALALTAAGGAFAASAASATEQTPNSGFKQMRGLPSAQGGSSDIERDPFRACVAAHPNDPHAQQNCDWDGSYKPK